MEDFKPPQPPGLVCLEKDTKKKQEIKKEKKKEIKKERKARRRRRRRRRRRTTRTLFPVSLIFNKMHVS
jgi:hypothetical protein